MDPYREPITSPSRVEKLILVETLFPLLIAQILVASGALVLILVAGMTIGPTLGGIAIEHYGPEGIFYLLSITAALTVMTGLFRWRSAPARVETRSSTVAVSAILTPEATRLYPDASSHEESSV